MTRDQEFVFVVVVFVVVVVVVFACCETRSDYGPLNMPLKIAL